MIANVEIKASAGYHFLVASTQDGQYNCLGKCEKIHMKMQSVIGLVFIAGVGIIVAATQLTEVMQVPNPGNPEGTPLDVTVPVIPASAMYPQLSLKNMSMDQALKLYLDNLRKDPGYEGKVALSFYGKVVDESGNPVEGASARLMWNTIAVPGGTAFKRVITDDAGLFSLLGRCGKCLGVRVEKEGYYIAEGGRGELNFEYAEPSSRDWYVPDANHPSVFHLRKKGAGANLFHKTLTFGLSNSHQSERINLIQGFLKPDGVLTITLDISKFLPGNQPYPWTGSLSMSEGGLVETQEQFPFLAPSTGYKPSDRIEMTNLDRSVWQDGVKRTYYFYLPSSNTYGRISVELSDGFPVLISYCYNPEPGSRVLELAGDRDSTFMPLPY